MKEETGGAFPVRADEEQRADRRRFLCAAGSAAALALAGEWGARRAERRLAEAPVIAAADATAPAAGEARVVVADDGREVLVVRIDEDSAPVAFDRRCPHLGCPVLWSAEHRRFECPCHHAAFDARTGSVLHGPPRRGLAAARVRTA